MADSEPAAKIQTRGLIRKYGKRQVVNGVDLQISGGEIVGLLGPNGAGKSSLMRTIATLQEPDAGSITLGDINVLGIERFTFTSSSDIPIRLTHSVAYGGSREV